MPTTRWIRCEKTLKQQAAFFYAMLINWWLEEGSEPRYKIYFTRAPFSRDGFIDIHTKKLRYLQNFLKNHENYLKQQKFIDSLRFCITDDNLRNIWYGLSDLNSADRRKELGQVIRKLKEVGIVTEITQPTEGDRRGIWEFQLLHLAHLDPLDIVMQKFAESWDIWYSSNLQNDQLLPNQEQNNLLSFVQSPRLDNPPFYGRQQDIQTLVSQVLHPQNKVIILWGQAGIGKTYLAKKITEDAGIRANYQYIIWAKVNIIQSLQSFLYEKVFAHIPTLDIRNIEDYISNLVGLLSRKRILLIIDNLERLRDNKIFFQEYVKLLEELATLENQSVVLVTTEKRISTSNIRHYQLLGLDKNALKELLYYQGITMDLEQAERVSLVYRGNPQILRWVGEDIQEIYQGNVTEFLRKTTYLPIPFVELLEARVNQLNDRQKYLARRVAIQEDSVTKEQLGEDMRRISIVTDNDLIHALQNLEYQAIIERHGNQFSMIPMIRKYFLNQIRVEFREECPDLLNSSTNLKKSILNQYQFIPGRMLNYLIQELSFEGITQEQLQNVLTRLQNPDNTHPLTGYFIDNLECLLSNM